MSELRYVVGSVALILDQHNRVLLGRRKNKNGQGFFGAPAGHVEADEPPRDTAVREAKEETDVALDGGDLFGVGHGQYIVDDPLPILKDRWIVIFYRFLVDSDRLCVRNLDQKNTESWDWYPLDDLPKNLFGPLEKMLEQLRKEIS